MQEIERGVFKRGGRERRGVFKEETLSKEKRKVNGGRGREVITDAYIAH